MTIRPTAAKNAADERSFRNTLTVQGYLDPRLGVQRGDEYVQAGYVQTVSVTALNASYVNNRVLTSPLQGNSYVDMQTSDSIDNPQLYSMWPWKETGYYVPQKAGSKTAFSLFSYDTLAAPKGAIKTGALNNPAALQFNSYTGDGPAVTVFQTINAAAIGFHLKSASIKENFVIYLAARSVDSEASANGQYYMLAQAKWDLDYSGTAVGLGNQRVPAFPVVRYVPNPPGNNPNASGMWVDGAGRPGNGVFGVVTGALPPPPPLPAANQVAPKQNNLKNWVVT